MLRIAIVIALLISLVTLSRLGMRLLEPEPTAKPPVTKQDGVATQSVEPEPSTTATSYYPAVPQALPDLNTGYLFTENRSVVGEGEGTPKGGPEKNGEPEVDIYSVVFIGSIISGNTRKAIISAPPPRDGQPKTTGRAGKVAGSRRAAAAQAKAQEYARVTEGEIFRGYKVKLVSPDKIVFERGEEIVERLLYDPSKKRAAGPPVFSRGPAMQHQGGPVSVPTPPPTPDRPVLADPSDARPMADGGHDNIVAEPQQPTAIIRRSPRPPAPEGESQPQGVLLERPPR